MFRQQCRSVASQTACSWFIWTFSGKDGTSRTHYRTIVVRTTGFWDNRFTCCKITQKIQISNSCSSLSDFTHHYITPTGRLPAYFLCLVFLYCRCKCFLHPFCFLLPDRHHTFPMLLTVCQHSVQCWQVIFYLCHCSPHVHHLRDRWTCVTPDSLLNGELYVSLSKPCRRMHAERCPPPYQSMGVSLSAADAWGKGSVF